MSKFSLTDISHVRKIGGRGSNNGALKKRKSPLVVDKERAIVNAVKAEMTNISVVHCWNHIFQDIRQWLKKHGATLEDITQYSDDLFHSESIMQYEQLFLVRSGMELSKTIIRRKYILMFPYILDGGLWKGCTFITHTVA